MNTPGMQLNILVASSEIVPFAKTGGLADVGNALPKALERLGHHPVIFMPAYRSTLSNSEGFTDLGVTVEIPIGSNIVTGRILKGQLPNSQVPVYLIDQKDYFDREGIYGNAGKDYEDNCARFVFFSRAVIEAVRLLNLQIDVIHCNDWQTGLIPAIINIEQRPAGVFRQAATVMTIHNLAYQGNFWHLDMKLTGIDWKHFNWQEMEFFGQLSLLKTGIVFADAISTVSPTYAQEIQTAEHGCGLDEVLKHRSNDLTGIINGVDYEVWNPATDSNLIANFDSSNWQNEKAKCKADLQRLMNLPEDPNVPVVGIIGRLAEQKGWDLIIDLMRTSLRDNLVQWVILGTGDPGFEQAISHMAEECPDKVGAQLTFSNELAHKIEAGSDMFLMPSRYEPCGLNQLYSLKYGTVPITRETGGLRDTVTNSDEQAVAAGTANGFTFEEYSAVAIHDALSRALITYFDHRDVWNRIVETGMNQDWSWNESARKYVELYQSVLNRLRPEASDNDSVLATETTETE